MKWKASSRTPKLVALIWLLIEPIKLSIWCRKMVPVITMCNILML
uniref:Uncharacterized protein n=1 Tax=Anguilla anguilla TaxID=7936 RepID=A0A0E9XGN3_ANGAN